MASRWPRPRRRRSRSPWPGDRAMRNRGFTIIELVMTVGMISLLATAAVPSAQLVYQRERESELRASLRTIRAAIDAYKRASDSGRIKEELDKRGCVPDLQSLGGGGGG